MVHDSRPKMSTHATQPCHGLMSAECWTIIDVNMPKVDLEVAVMLAAAPVYGWNRRLVIPHIVQVLNGVLSPGGYVHRT